MPLLLNENIVPLGNEKTVPSYSGIFCVISGLTKEAAR